MASLEVALVWKTFLAFLVMWFIMTSQFLCWGNYLPARWSFYPFFIDFAFWSSLRLVRCWPSSKLQARPRPSACSFLAHTTVRYGGTRLRAGLSLAAVASCSLSWCGRSCCTRCAPHAQRNQQAGQNWLRFRVGVCRGLWLCAKRGDTSSDPGHWLAFSETLSAATSATCFVVRTAFV